MDKKKFTFHEALHKMANNDKMRLPEWTGYWFQHQGRLFAFTRTGDVVPAWEQRADMQLREDWEEANDGLGFDFAILALKAGKKVCRAGWNGKGMFIFMQKGYPDGIGLNKNTAEALGVPEGQVMRITPYLMMRAADSSLVTGWLASQTDMLATDWEIAAQ